jgi:hypothetical protein
MALNIYELLSPLMRKFRGQRLKVFLQVISPRSKDRILDVGGYPEFWTQHAPVAGGIDCLNVHEVPWDSEKAPEHHISMKLGNGCVLDMPDGSYEILFSNSVIEHVGEWEDQQAFARESRRVGGKLWIQTPAYECPIEPHYVGFFIHRLPKAVQLKVIRWITLWGWMHRPTPEAVAHEVNSIRLLKKKEMEELYPDCEILTERLFGLFPKSYIAVRRQPPQQVA